ncbi:hypothetical protein BDV30DRAFT_232930 [Aspergillus minisclerotigenes]|uniref:Secreted protein n=1 Tax=Aspergillus minisclerotigenes TaxID=656917 RepID=A0A5N6JM97_9EURO|nr:hypothetical protein BDV30DRAFT_232930 [Aspergillus minisclerotigenes]
MKASLISVILLAAVATVSAQPGGSHNTGVIPEIVVSPPSDGNGVSDKNIGPTDANKLGQSGMLYGICDTRTRKPTCKKKIGGKWTSKKCLNKCTEGSCRFDPSQPSEPADCSIPKQQ